VWLSAEETEESASQWVEKATLHVSAFIVKRGKTSAYKSYGKDAKKTPEHWRINGQRRAVHARRDLATAHDVTVVISVLSVYCSPADETRDTIWLLFVE